MNNTPSENQYTFDTIANEEFMSKEQIRDALKNCAKDAGFSVATLDSNNSYLNMGCSHAGRPRKKVSISDHQRNCTSGRIACPFRATAHKIVLDDGKDAVWKTLKIHDPKAHNHELAENINFYSAYRQPRTADQKRHIVQLMNAGVKDTAIARTMNAIGVGMTPKDVANFRYEIKTLLQGDYEVESLVLDLQEKGYTVRYSFVESAIGVKKHLRSIFFTHQDSIDLANQFNEVVTIDATYKTVRSKLPFVNVVGVSNISNGRGQLSTFGIAGGWISDETADSYEWFIQQLKNTVWSENDGPNLVITDSELALTNAIDKVFPQAKRALCKVHIRNNFRSQIKKYFSKTDWDEISKAINYMTCMDFKNPLNEGVTEAVMNDSLFVIGKQRYLAMAKKSTNEAKVVQYLNQ